MVDVQSFMMEPKVEGEEEGLEEEEGEEREALLNCHDQRRLGIVHGPVDSVCVIEEVLNDDFCTNIRKLFIICFTI